VGTSLPLAATVALVSAPVAIGLVMVSETRH
jgi:hypothetical protein